MVGKETDIVQIESAIQQQFVTSVPMLMLCKYVRENTDVNLLQVKVDDEAGGSYLYS